MDIWTLFVAQSHSVKCSIDLIIDISTNMFLKLFSKFAVAVAGIVAEDSSNIDQILHDYRVEDAVHEGLNILNLDAGKLITTKSLQDKIVVSSLSFLIMQRVKNYQMQLRMLSEDEDSTLLYFVKFFQKGCSTKENWTIQSLKLTIRDHLSSLLNLKLDKEEIKLYSDFDAQTQQYTFLASKMATYLQCHSLFLSLMAETQLFMEFLQRKKQHALELRASVLISMWLSSRLKRKKSKLN